ncbi:hypothetical protein M5585_17635 [Serratia ureilytica]
MNFIAAAGDFSYAELGGAVAAGAVGGAMTGAMAGGVGAGQALLPVPLSVVPPIPLAKWWNPCWVAINKHRRTILPTVTNAGRFVSII